MLSIKETKSYVRRKCRLEQKIELGQSVIRRHKTCLLRHGAGIFIYLAPKINVAVNSEVARELHMQREDGYKGAVVLWRLNITGLAS